MKKTILIVEDEPDLAQIVAYNLARGASDSDRLQR